MPIFLSWLLLLLAACDGGRRQQMEALLNRADSLNRAYIPMTGGLDSLLSEAASYYDRHGSPNEQLRVHYLLGCAYRDMGDAPQALQCYQDAVDRADTLASDCDYHRLMAVYGQMADLFHAQNLPEDELTVLNYVQNCARKKNDTLLYVRSIELKARPFFLLKDTVSMLAVLQQSKQLYERFNMYSQAKSSYPLIIDIHLSYNQLDKAKELMEEFEHESSFFDTDGNIIAGRESYYELKGLYYQKTNQLDSAEYYFRKLLRYGLETDAYRGLLSIYRSKKNSDSISLFSNLYESAIDEERDAEHVQIIHQISSMYNYQRFQRKAAYEKNRSSMIEKRLLVSLTFLIVIFFLFIITYNNLRRKNKEKAKEVQYYAEAYAAAICDRDNFNRELEILREDSARLKTSEQHTLEQMKSLRSNNALLIAQKEAEIVKLNKKISEYAERLKLFDVNKDDGSLGLLCEVFHKKATRQRNISLPSNAEWIKLIRLFSRYQPLAYAKIGRDQILSSYELRTCTLFLLGFSNNEVQSLLDVSPQRLSNIRFRINKKLFNDGSAATLPDNLKRIHLV